MDSHKPPQTPENLMEDLRSIHELLSEPLATPETGPEIPLLSEVVVPARSPADELRYLDLQLRAAAQLVLQDVIDDFAPQIEAELQRRLQLRLQQLLKSRS